MTSLKPEQTFLVAIAAKAAVTNAPLEIHETGSWWLPMGSQWLQILCKNVSPFIDVIVLAQTRLDFGGQQC